ncbi:MAG: HDIG domain-containing metalloprotein [Planctomycetota bacterium]
MATPRTTGGLSTSKRQTIRLLRSGRTGGVQRPALFTRTTRPFWLMGVFFTLYIGYILYLDVTRVVFREDWPAMQTYIARVDFSCEDLTAMMHEASHRARQVPPVFTPDTSWVQTVMAPLDRLAAVARADAPDLQTACEQWPDLGTGAAPQEFLRFLRDDGALWAAFRERAEYILAACARTGVVLPADLAQLEASAIIVSPRPPEQKTPAATLLTPARVLGRLERGLAEGFGPALVQPFLAVIGRNLPPSLFKSEPLTESYRAEIRGAVTPIYKDVARGTVIINEGEIISSARAVELAAEQKAFRTNLQTIDQARMLFGFLVFTAAFVGIVAVYMWFFETPLPVSQGKLFIYFLIVMAFVALTKGCNFLGIPANAVPLVFVGMITAIVINLRFGVVMVLLLTIVTGIVFRAGNAYTAALFASGAVGVFYCRYIRRRAHVLWGGVVAGILNAVIIFGVSFSRSTPFLSVLPVGLAGFLSCCASGIVLVGVLPLVEYLFDTTTDVRLLELSDQGHPLLRTLFLQASGTYTHSLGVGNLAESAAAAVGVNTLLARVAAYFHDIGKIFKPEFFIENQAMGGNKHERLRPGLSALIIASHTRDGIELGREYRLPQRVLDIIGEHHGTSKIMYFLQKAQAAAVEGERVDEQFFRYPGTLPTSRESGIVMLADSVEAASRTLPTPTASSLRKMVDRIIRAKMDDNQLGETQLTMVDISRIRESFVATLHGMFHARIEYPEEKA